MKNIIPLLIPVLLGIMAGIGHGMVSEQTKSPAFLGVETLQSFEGGQSLKD
jgi:hypothetical protein